MNMNLKYKILFLLLISSVLEAQTYYNQYNNAEDSDITERMESLYQSGDTTIVLGIEKGDSPVFFNLYIDSSGNQIDKVYADTTTYGAANIFDGKNDGIIQMQNVVNKPGSVRFIDVSKKGEILNVKEIDLFTEISSYFISNFLVTSNRYIFSGIVTYAEGKHAFMVNLDHDFNLIKAQETSSEFRNISGLTETTDGRILGVMAYVDFEMSECSFCPNYAKYYISEFDASDSQFFDTLYLALTGYGYKDYRLPMKATPDNGIVLINPVSFSDEEYDSELRIRKFNGDIGFMWNLDSFPINKEGDFNPSMHILDSGDIVFSVYSLVRDDLGFESDNIIISYIASSGDLSWSKSIVRYQDELGRRKTDYATTHLVEVDGYFIFGGNHNWGGGFKPIVSKITKKGCLHEDCRILEVAGYFPPPRSGLSYRNIWHVHNTKTDERYRYTFIEIAIPEIGGSLLRSDEMSGDNWYTTGRLFRGNENVLKEKRVFTTGSSIIDYDYNYDFDVGDVNGLVQPPLYLDWKQVVVAKDFIQFNDGRFMRRLTMQCYEGDEVMEEFDPVTWIDYLGDPSDLFNTYNACSSRGSEVVTCFYSAGDLMWSHPDYTDCAPLGVQDEESVPTIIFPNPASDLIQVNHSFGKYKIVSSNGQLVTEGNEIKVGETIDISQLPKGSYYIYEIDRLVGGKVIPFSKF
ncbi:MAG: hypothetical protein ACI86M_003620 [Saprospiraceae bacterium]|jgi:hypothetical protein